jgi:hypothetical protein
MGAIALERPTRRGNRTSAHRTNGLRGAGAALRPRRLMLTPELRAALKAEVDRRAREELIDCQYEEGPPLEGVAKKIYARRGDGGFLPCFQCGERRQIRKGYVCCDSCIRPVPSSPEDEAFPCGCTESFSPRVVEKHWVPPWPHCVACRGTGRIKDKHHHLKIRSGAGHPKHWFGEEGSGATPRQGHVDESLEAVERAFLQADGWKIENAGSTGRPPGRPQQGIHDRLVALEHVKGISSRVRLKITRDGNLETPRREWQQAEARIIAQVPDYISAETVAEIFGKGKRRVEQIRKISQNPPKGGSS